MNIVRNRMANQFLTAPWRGSIAALVQKLGAVQAQDYAGAKWALSLRTNGVNDAEIENELARGRILRTHVLRPTWHFVAPDDIRWMLALTAPHIQRRMATYDRRLGLTPSILRRCCNAIAKSLAGNNHLTSAELRAMLSTKRLGKMTPQQLAHVMMHAELEAVVCSGARNGTQFTYALLDERVPETDGLRPDQALAELTMRYFVTRSPATVHDFAWWSGLPVREARRGITSCSASLHQFNLNGKQYWQAARIDDTQQNKRTAHLLPNYDEYFIGYKDRSAIGDRLANVALVSGGDSLIAHVIFVDGQIVGGWKRRNTKSAVELDFRLLTTLTPAELKRVLKAALGLARFLGIPGVTCRDSSGREWRVTT
jgi:hypothetical protein